MGVGPSIDQSQNVLVKILKDKICQKQRQAGDARQTNASKALDQLPWAVTLGRTGARVADGERGLAISHLHMLRNTV